MPAPLTVKIVVFAFNDAVVINNVAVVDVNVPPVNVKLPPAVNEIAESPPVNVPAACDQPLAPIVIVLVALCVMVPE